MRIGLWLMMAQALCCTACSGSGKTVQETAAAPQAAVTDAFSADSAYAYVERQVAFGPRVPGTQGHDACRDWLVSTLRGFGPDTLIVQHGQMKAFTGEVLPLSNIFASFNSRATRRVLLVAHWDTRPWADSESDPGKRQQPIPGANDGGSGTAVLLEIARNLAEKAPEAGVDILLVDGEDYGDSEGAGDRSDTWCLGSQMWVKDMPYTPANTPAYGILLDMVGAPGAVFPREYFSQQLAPNVVAKVWNEAGRLGFADIFLKSEGGAVTDDHLVLSTAGIPTVDIIESQHPATGSFGPAWHTHADDMSNIDRRTLGAVGKTVLNVVYKEKS